MTAYLDNAATTQVCPEAAAAAMKMMTEVYGNPSSTHTMGREAKAVLEASRASVARALGGKAEEVFFTSCGSESDNWALRSSAELLHRKGKHIISSTVEHSAVLKSLDILEKQGYTVTRLHPEADGSISPDAVKNALREDTILVSLMLVNNETGAVTDIPAIAKLLKASGSPALLHTDAVQGFLKIPFSVKTLGADMVSVSGHKIHAPKGIGALWVKGGVKTIRLAPLIAGGLQEGGRRAGTEALPNIAAFAAACDAGKTAFAESYAHEKALRALAVSRLTAENEGLRVLSPDDAAPGILSISLPGYRSETLMNALEVSGIFVSKSSACKKGHRSYVLEELGLPADVIDGTIRISFSRFTTEDEVNWFCDELCRVRKSVYTKLH
ncbi:MAG: cysteine desulfurase family protein [Oscillospiraceae bacterium]|jgi:cysteine desulfurase